MPFEITLWIGVGICVLAFFSEYIDSTLGMGYGTMLTPILLLMGFEPLVVVPAILLSELLTGIAAGVAHHSAGNANFKPKTTRLSNIIKNIRRVGPIHAARRGLPMHLKTVILIAACGAVGSLIAVFFAINVSKFVLKLYIGIMILSMGLYILIRRNREMRFSLKRLVGWGLLASFNKGMSGGGYGPIVTGGQILSGVDSRSAVAITSLAEGLVCLVGFTAYFLTIGISNWTLFPLLCVGAMLSVPLSAYTVKKIRVKKLKLIIGILTVTLGAVTLIKLAF